MVFKFHGPGKQINAAVVSGERSLEQTVVETGDVFGNIPDGVFRDDIEPNVGIAESQIQIDDHG
jgi:hypothetical protein